MSLRTIGIVGASGAVGRASAVLLLASGAGRLRLGAREPGRAQRMLGTSRDVDVVAVDVERDGSLAAFCDGCRVVVNCAGPSYRLLDRVARAAFQAGAAYVDPAGDEPLFARISSLGTASPAPIAVRSAGMLPGLSALLPRWLAGKGFDRARTLLAFACVRDRFTPAAAADYLLSLGGTFGEPLAMWRHAARARHALEPLRDVEVPLLAGRFNAYPYLTAETERLALLLGLDEARSYNLFEDDRMLATVSRLQRALAGGGNLTACALELVRAVDMELFGRVPEQRLVFRVDGEQRGRPVSRALLCRASSTYEVTAGVVAAAVMAALRGSLPGGVHFAASVLDPAETVDRLRRSSALRTFEVIDDVDCDSAIVEGAL